MRSHSGSSQTPNTDNRVQFGGNAAPFVLCQLLTIDDREHYGTGDWRLATDEGSHFAAR